EALASDPIAELLRIYRIADSLAKEDAGVLEKCREELVKLQNGDPDSTEIWKKCVELSRQEFDKIYSLLGVNFDFELGESFYHSELPKIVQELEAEGLAERSHGAIVVWDPALSRDPFIIQKSDGGFGYAATDVATIRYRIRRWNPDAIWYVVGAPQQLHFRQLFSLARRMGYELELEHISFGSILGEDKRLMRTRSGDSVPLRELLQESIERAGALLEGKTFPSSERLQIAQTIGLGAVKYADLSQHRLTDYVFSWNKMLSLQGNTAPYLQNAYVRTQSIFRKLDGAFSLPDAIQIMKPSELALAKRLVQFGDVVPSVLEGFKPNLLANFLYQLASEFHAFYESCPVLTADNIARASRLLLCQNFARVLGRGLELLGIEVPDKM
ncbi:MAG: arginine--tRNA ligase, partial [Verrucomicrobia bacterium]|nr:arginine--tRNA ligase [Verrucomicrobiota bacterium]